MIGIATITGPLVGGLIIRDDITGGSWRWIFLVNLPIGIAALIAATRLISESRAPNATRLDLGGVVLSTAGILLLVYPLVEGQVAGWPAWTFICMAISPFALLAFVLYERSLPSTRFPLVQLSLFRIRSFSVGVAISAVFIAGIPAFFFTFSLMLQVGSGFQRAQRGLDDDPVEPRFRGRIRDVDSRRPAARQVHDRDRIGAARGRHPRDHLDPPPRRHEASPDGI